MLSLHPPWAGTPIGQNMSLSMDLVPSGTPWLRLLASLHTLSLAITGSWEFTAQDVFLPHAPMFPWHRTYPSPQTLYLTLPGTPQRRTCPPQLPCAQSSPP